VYDFQCYLPLQLVEESDKSETVGHRSEVFYLFLAGFDMIPERPKYGAQMEWKVCTGFWDGHGDWL
jgi:hypothetical protein